MLKSHADRVEMLKNSPVVPYALDGKRDTKMFDFLRKIHDHWEWTDGYVGVIPIGSRIKGYAKSDSDIDLYFLGGNSLTIDRHTRAKTLSTIGKQLGIVASFVDHINGERLHRNISSPTSEFGYELNFLMRPMIGIPAKIQHLHFLLRARFNDTPPYVDIQSQISRAVYYLLDDDFGGVKREFSGGEMQFSPNWITIDSDEHFYKQYREKRTLYKMLQRGFTREEINDIFEARKKMWRRRIQHLIDGTGPFHHLGHTEPFEDIMKMLGEPI